MAGAILLEANSSLDPGGVKDLLKRSADTAQNLPCGFRIRVRLC